MRDLKKIAVIGSGISGLYAAYKLGKDYQVTLYESENRFGGHANTVFSNDSTTKEVPIDTGFIVYNTLTYPGLTKLFSELGVDTVETDMSFGVQDEKSGIEYSTKNIKSMYAQKRNILNWSFHSIWIDFMKFRDVALDYYHQIEYKEDYTTVGELVKKAKCRKPFWDLFLYPMTGAIWSTAPAEMHDFPAKSFVGFMMNHRMLDTHGQPIWRTVRGGSINYVQKVISQGKFQTLKGQKVISVKKILDQFSVKTETGTTNQYDEVVIATHSDQALTLIEDVTPVEREVLSAIRYQKNTAVLHNDASLMPKNHKAWAAWNVYLKEFSTSRVELTYDMNRLQHIERDPWFVTLNPSRSINESKIHKTIQYHHPFFDKDALKAQVNWDKISGVRGLHFCGAYWKWGFHEDGLWSAQRVVEHISMKEHVESRA